MFHHVKELQFNARVSGPDPRFAKLLLEQFGGGNGELKAAMQYFVQAFGHKSAHPDKYDLLMDIATEEFSHLEIVGATITMLLQGVNGELKNAVERSSLGSVMKGKSGREDLIHEALTNPEFLVLSGGGPVLTNAAGAPWTGAYVNANGEITVDLRSDIAAESRAKIVYEYLLQFTDDAYVRESLNFLMTREVAHMQMFHAALDSVAENFPPGVLEGDPRYTHTYFNLSNGEDVRGAWNEGQGPWTKGERWNYIDEPVSYVRQTKGLTDLEPEGSSKSVTDAQKLSREKARRKATEVNQAMPIGELQWSTFRGKTLKSGT